MTEDSTPYQIPYLFMNDFTKRKYAINVRNTIKSIKISPTNYTKKSSLNDRWFVYFWYKRAGENKRRKFEVSSLEINGTIQQLNRLKEHNLKIECIELIKEHLIDMYSLRHTAIGDAFSNLCKELKDEPDYKNKAIDYIMTITNHKTREQTKQYLRGVCMDLHVDWSKYLN